MLPDIQSPAELERLRLELDPWRDALHEITRRHGLSGQPTPERAGSLPVFSQGELVIKLYASSSAWVEEGSASHAPDGGPLDYEAERATLLRVHGRVPVATPEVLADGALEDWRYLVMRRLPGQPLESVLAQASPSARRDAVRQLGELTAALHAVEAADLPSWVPDFDALLTHQASHVVDIERGRGAQESWLEALARFVAQTPRGEVNRRLLHTELGPGHVLAQLVDERVVLTGLIDFVDAMVGDAEYDFAAVAMFITGGDGVLLAAFLDGYGWRGPRGLALSRRIMRYLLLHRFAALPWLLARRPPGSATDFDELVEPWIGIA